MNPNIPEKKSNFMFGVALGQMKRVQIALILNPFGSLCCGLVMEAIKARA